MFHFILPETVPDLVAAETRAGDDGNTYQADAAAERVRADYGRTSRWGMGLLGTVGALVAVLFASLTTDVATSGFWTPGDLVTTFIAAALTAAAGVPSAMLLLGLHRSGRRLTAAAAYWTALPDRREWRSPTAGDWFTVRFLGFSRDLFPRLVTSALARLGVIFAASLLIRALVEGLPAFEVVLWAGAAIVFGAVCVGQFGGVQRLQNAFVARDPAGRRR